MTRRREPDLNPRSRQDWRDAQSGRRVLGRGLAVLAVLAVLPWLSDAVAGQVKQSEGCRVLALNSGDSGWFLCPGNGVVAGRLQGYTAPAFWRGACAHERGLAVQSLFALRVQLWQAGTIVARSRARLLDGRTEMTFVLDGVSPGAALVGKGLAQWGDGRARGWCG